MTKNEMKELAVLIANELSKKIQGIKVVNDDEFVDTAEAAKILGYSPAYMRQVRNKYPHIKAGTDKQGRLLFRRKDLIVNFQK